MTIQQLKFVNQKLNSVPLLSLSSDLEEKLYSFYKSQRELGRLISGKALITKMLRLYCEKYQLTQDEYDSLRKYQFAMNRYKLKENPIYDEDEKFTKEDFIRVKELYKKLDNSVFLCSPKWFFNFRKRYKIAYRKINHIAGKNKHDLAPVIGEFLNSLHSLRLECDYPLELMINFDETPIFFDSIPYYCYADKGISRVEVKTPALQNKRLTVGLGCSAAGLKLRPILIYKGKGEGFKKLHNHQNYLLFKNGNGWMTEQLFCLWMNIELKAYLIKQRELLKKPYAKAIFIVDRFAGHFPEKDFNKLKRDLNIDILYIPAGTTALLQPLDLMINQRMKHEMKERWLSWYMDVELAKKDIEHPNRQHIYDWLHHSWEAISSKAIVQAFLKAGISNKLDGSEDGLSENLEMLKKLNDLGKVQLDKAQEGGVDKTEESKGEMLIKEACTTTIISNTSSKSTDELNAYPRLMIMDDDDEYKIDGYAKEERLDEPGQDTDELKQFLDNENDFDFERLIIKSSKDDNSDGIDDNNDVAYLIRASQPFKQVKR